MLERGSHLTRLPIASIRTPLTHITKVPNAVTVSVEMDEGLSHTETHSLQERQHSPVESAKVVYKPEVTNSR
jgi:hypothetical protein